MHDALFAFVWGTRDATLDVLRVGVWISSLNMTRLPVFKALSWSPTLG